MFFIRAGAYEAFVMRVLQCVNYFYPSVGGTQLATHHLAKNLAQLEVDVKIVTFDVNPLDQLKNGYCSAGLPSYEKIDEIPVYRFPVVFLGKTKGSQPLYKIIVSPSAIKMVLREKPDIIHFQGANEVLQAIMTSYASTFSRSKTVLTVHGLHAQIDLFRKQRFSKWINELLLRLALGKADHIVALSKNDLGPMSYLKISHDKVSVIPNGIDLSKYLTPVQDKQPLQQIRSPDTQFILCVTRIRENKGIEFLIRAAAHVVSKRPKVKFLLVGNCPEAYAVELRRLVKKVNVEKNFILMGYIPHESDDLLALYRRASIFVLPSLMESLPLVLLEAMAANLPIVASRVGGIPDLVGPSEGILITPGDVAELSSSLLFLLDNDAVRSRLGHNAREKVKNYSWDRIAKKTMSMYEKLLAS